jgi:hypothetical protein
LGQEPLAEKGCGVGKGLDLGSSDGGVFLEFQSESLAVASQILLQILLAHGDFMQIEAQSFVNDIVHQFGTLVTTSFFLSTKGVSATNINISTALSQKKKGL